jgi:uncharacterized protein (TIGR03437 family)
MIYTLAGQISAIVPYSVTGKTTTQVQVEYKGVPSPPVTISVAAAAPGIFTAYPSGRGEAAMLNESGCCNTPLSPAARGSIVTVFATGEGQTAPTGVDGRLAEFPRLADFPRPLLPVTVTVGGLPAKVEYAGAAPGYVAGLMQVNFRVPEAVAPSNAVPVMLTVGTVRSPAGVTMAVR